MIVDIHTHTFPDKLAPKAIPKLSQTSHTKPFSDGTNSGLICSMKEADINISVLMPVATTPNQVTIINDTAAANNVAYGKDGLLSFGGIHPDYKNYEEELERIVSLGLKGIKVHPVYQRTNLDDPRYINILKKAAKLGLIVLTHGGIDIGFPGQYQSSPDKILNVIKQVPDLNLICAHMGGWKQWDQAIEFLKDTNVYLDTAFSIHSFAALDDGHHKPDDCQMLDEEAFFKFINIFGADHILFGTDSPWTSQAEEVTRIQNLKINNTSKNKILGENAKRLLGL